MNKKGFTIVEIMAVLIIIAILATLIVGGVTRYSKKGQESYYDSLKNHIDLAGKSYYSDHPKMRPTGSVSEGSDKVVGEKLYVKDIKDYFENDVVGANGEDCSDSYLVVRLIDGKYKYDTCLICNGIAYNDNEDGICEIPDSNLVNENKNSDVTLDIEDTNAPTCTISSSPSTISKEKTLEIVSSNKNIKYSFDNVSFIDDNKKTVNSPGTYNAYVKNSYGTGTCSITLTSTDIDNTKPTCTLDISGSGLSRTLTINSSDTDLNNLPYSFDGTTYNTTKTKSVSVAGTYTAYIKDKAGNIGTCSSNVVFDSDGPSISPSVTGGKNIATIRATISDPSGVSGYAITSSTATPTSWTSVSNLPTTNVSFPKKTSAGTYYIHAKDSLGNTNYKSVTLTLTTSGSCGCAEYDSVYECNDICTNWESYCPNPLPSSGSVIACLGDFYERCTDWEEQCGYYGSGDCIAYKRCWLS